MIVSLITLYEDKKQILIPSGCAHGFLCLSEATITYVQGGIFDTSQEKV
jgi:dTDP-4-dehydrorhamnose 3,5-epimerase-like enzyme